MAAAPYRGLLLVLLVVSGAVSLVYQSLWTRQLSLILGSTTYAIGTVLAAFMAGLGVGAHVLGRRSDRSAAPLRLYALLELAIGIFGLASPVVLAQGNRLYAVAYAALHEVPRVLGLARFLIGFSMVATPAFCMGGTLPAVARWIVRRPERIARELGALYALNTLGAAMGALALPFVLLPALGMHRTLLACAAANLTIAAVSWAIARRVSALAPTAIARTPATPVPGLMPAFFVSGFVALGLETVWNRFFAMYFGSSIYSYALILVVYLTGVFVGGTLYARFARPGGDPRRVFGACLGLLVADLLVTVPLMDRVLYVQLAVLDRLGVTFGAIQWANAVAAVLVILPPTLLLGVAFPAAVAATSRGVTRLGADLGHAYLVNTAGTVAGALAAAFVLIPGLGVRGSLDLLVALAALAFGLAVDRREWAPGRRRALAALALALAVVPTLLPGWDLRLMHTGISRDPEMLLPVWRLGVAAQVVREINVREVLDGVDATVSVVQYGGPDLALLVNGKVDASDGQDMFTQGAIGHLPLVVHPAPHDVLVVGMGSGVTMAAVAHHPVTAIDLVEISPEVVTLADRHFRVVNEDVLADPRVRVHIEDGRNFIAFEPTRTFDVIISEPSNPWMAGVASLFTDEFFAQARSRLRRGGVLCQWFHYYQMDFDDVRAVVGAMARNFPFVYGFAFSRQAAWIGDLVLLASVEQPDFGALLRAVGGVGPASENIHALGITTETDVLGALVISPETVTGFVANAPINSDDRPGLELHAPRAVFTESTRENLRKLISSSAGVRLPVTPRRGMGGRSYRTRLFQATAPAGYRLTFAGYQMDVHEPDAENHVARDVLRARTFTDAAGDRVEVLSARHAVDDRNLPRLAALAAGSPGAVSGETTVNGHPAITWHGSDGTEAVAWNCPETRTAHAAAHVPGAGGGGFSGALRGIHCRHS